MTTALKQALNEIYVLKTELASANSRQTLQSTTLADGVATVFPLPNFDIYGNPVNFIIGRSYGSAGTGGGANPSFSLVGTAPASPARYFIVSGVPGSYVATFSVAPTEIALATPSVVTFDISTPLI